MLPANAAWPLMLPASPILRQPGLDAETPAVLLAQSRTLDRLQHHLPHQLARRQQIATAPRVLLIVSLHREVRRVTCIRRQVDSVTDHTSQTAQWPPQLAIVPFNPC